MTYVITGDCIDTKDRACLEECPVDCIYEGDRKLYVNPVECIDCGACETACPVQAITSAFDVKPAQLDFIADNAVFFSEPLPGRARPLGNPGGAGKTGPIGIDTPLVSTYAP